MTNHHTPTSSRTRTLMATGLAVLAALIAAIGWSAGTGSASAAGDPGTSGNQTIQQATPTPEQDRSAPGGREDCPEKDGSGSGSGSGSGDSENQSL